MIRTAVLPAISGYAGPRRWSSSAPGDLHAEPVARVAWALVAAPGRVFSRDQLMHAAWDDPGAALDRTVDAHIKLLRAKLRAVAPEADPIVTHRGMGYSLREET